MNPGLLDLPAPLFDAFDRILAPALPEAVRIALYGVAVSYVGMLLYARRSNQPRLRAVRRLTRRVRRRLQDPEIEFAPLLAAARSSLRLSVRHLALVLAPSLLTLLPLLWVLPWASNRFGIDTPAPGTPLHWCIVPEARAAEIRIGNAIAGADACLRLDWPATPTPIRQDGRTIATAPWTGASPVLHAARWWNLFVANPAGTLPASAGNLEIRVSFPPHRVLGIGPEWLGHWLFWFLVPGGCAGFYWRWRWRLV